MTHYKGNRDLPCPKCHKRRDITWRPRQYNFVCKCGSVFTRQEAEESARLQPLRVRTSSLQKAFDIDILETLIQPKTVRQVAEQLGISVERMRVRIHRLESSGKVRRRNDQKDLRKSMYYAENPATILY
jgi:FixJ family two-component response regulator